MGILGDIKIDNLGSVFSGLGQLAKDIRTAITGVDPVKKAEIEAKLVELEAAAASAQTAINLEEAKSSSVFVAGWRPAIGWCCAIAIACNYLVTPMVIWGSQLAGYPLQPPILDSAELYSLVLAMLGLGGLRSWEKTKGVAR